MELSAEQLSLIANSYAMEKRAVMEKYDMTSIEVDVMLFLANNPQFDTAAEIVSIRKIAGRRGLLRFSSPMSTKQSPPARNILLWLRPRHSSSNPTYRLPPKANRGQFFRNSMFITSRKVLPKKL